MLHTIGSNRFSIMMNDPSSHISQDVLAMFQKRDFPSLIKHFDQVLHQTRSLEEKASILRNRSICYHQQGIYQSALQDIEQALILQPDNPTLVLYKAKILIALGQVDNAKKLLTDLNNAITPSRHCILDVSVLYEASELSTAIDSSEIQQETHLPLFVQYQRQEQQLKSTQQQTTLGTTPLHTKDKKSKSSSIPSKQQQQSTKPPVPVSSKSSTATTSSTIDPMLRVLATSNPAAALSIAVQLINQCKYSEALPLLDAIIDKTGSDVSVLAARGTARAYIGNLHGAVDDFNKAIILNPQIPDLYKRRSQALAVLDRNQEALQDLNAAYKLLCTSVNDDDQEIIDVLIDRANMHHKRRDYNKAEKDSKQALGMLSRLETSTMTPSARATASKSSSQSLFSMLASCQVNQGDLQQGIASYRKVLEVCRDDTHAVLSLGMALKEVCQVDESIKVLHRALKLSKSPSYEIEVRRLLAQLYIGLGQHAKAIQESQRAASVAKKDSDKIEFHFTLGVCHHALGEYKQAITNYQAAMEAQTPHITEKAVSHVCLSFFQKEIAIWMKRNLDKDVNTICVDAEFTPEFKEYWCKKTPPNAEFIQRYQCIMQPPILNWNETTTPLSSSHDEMICLVQAADAIGVLVQYNHQGFLPNKRQQRMAGLAAIEFAQMLVQAASQSSDSATTKAATFTTTPRNNTTPKAILSSSILVRDSGASVCARGPSGIGGGGRGSPNSYHSLCWRDAMDLIVKWRQLAEPGDQVLWVDLLSEKEFKQGFGSHTPMYTGQTKCVRYYMNFDRAMEVIKRVIHDTKKVFQADDTPLEINEKNGKLTLVERAKTAEDLWNAIEKDSYVVAPIESTTRKGHVMEGTRLTIVNLSDIHQHGLPGDAHDDKKNGKLESELAAMRLEQQEQRQDMVQPDAYEFSIRTPVTPARWEDYDQELAAMFNELIQHMHNGDTTMAAEYALRFAYYWYNFMPLARGSAMCGYVSILGSFLAMGTPLRSAIPSSCQTDWDAILERSPDAFIAAQLSWMRPCDEEEMKKKEDGGLPYASLDKLPKVSNVLKTMRDRLIALNM